MIYKVFIALNSVKTRRVGDVISVLEKEGLEFVGIQKKTTNPSCKEYPDLEHQTMKNQLNGMKAMVFYQKKFSPGVLAIKMSNFYRNRVELFFESEELSFNPDELWEEISKKVFRSERKLPIMFVMKDEGVIVDDSKAALVEVDTFIPTAATDITLDWCLSKPRTPCYQIDSMAFKKLSCKKYILYL